MARKYITAPAYYRFFYGTPDEIVVTPQDQMDASTLTFTEIFADQMSQASTSRADAVVSGFNVEASVSIAAIGNIDLFAALFNGSDDLTIGQRRLIGVASRPGCPVRKSSIMIKLADCDGESIDPLDWFFLPNAAFFTTDTSFNFSNTDQASYTLTVAAFDPEPESIYYPYKALRGDIGIINGDPAPPSGSPSPAPSGDPFAAFANSLLMVTTGTPVNDGTNNANLSATAGDRIGYNNASDPGALPAATNLLLNGTAVGLFAYPSSMQNQPFIFRLASNSRTYTGNAGTPLLLTDDVELSNFAFIQG